MAFIDKLLLKLSPKTVIERSQYFDKKWYSEKYGIEGDPARHYLEEGWLKEYDPSMKFSTKDYLINNPDIKGINPLLHYEVFGKNEGRRPFVPKLENIGDYKADRIDIPYEKYYKIIEDKKVVSFDVFDTLVNRPFVKADDLFEYMEKESSLKGLAEDRKNMESEARKTLNKEVNIDDIYLYLDERYEALKDKEIEYEIRLCHRNPSIYPIYEKAKELGKRVIATSDMYLGKQIVEKVLENSGYKMDEIYVSCDVDKTKGSGELYKYVMNAESIEAGDMIHFGDNYISDYSEARNNDIEAYQTPKIVDQALSDPKNKWLLSFMNRHESLGTSIYLAQMAEYLSSEEDLFFAKLGYVLGGPLAYGYLDFVCKKAKEIGVDELLFVSRDGYILKDLYEKYLIGRCQIPGAYAYLSRAAIFAGGIDNHLNKDLGTLLKIAQHHLPGLVKEANEEEYFRNKEEIDAWSKKQSENLRKHLKEIAESFYSVATVDMFSGNYTSQKGLKYYLDSKAKTGFYAGNFADNAVEHESYANRLLGMRDNLPVKVSEFLITSYEDSIIGVDENGRPIYEGREDPGRKERFEQIRKGLYAYFDDQKKNFGLSGIGSIDLEEWLDLCSCYLNECPDADIEKLSVVIDSEDPVSNKKDIGFDKLIDRFRENGY